MNRRFLVGLVMVGLYALSTGSTYAIFRGMNNSSPDNEVVDPTPLTPEETADKRSRVNPGEPKTEKCPINGEMFTKTEKEIWATRRPLGVMIENHSEARPQSGLSYADVVYEALAEGGITRFMGIFYCGAAASDVALGPVRSARTYFLDWVSEYGMYPLYAHVGGANCNKTTGSGCQNGAKADAIGQIQKYGWNLYNDMNQMVGVDLGVKVFRRDNRLEKYTGNNNIAYEHTMYTSTDKLWDVAAKRGLNYVDDQTNEGWDADFVPWKFKADKLTAGADATSIDYVFWDQFSDTYKVNWKYDPTKNIYLRSNGGQPHLDLETKQQIGVTNVVLLFMKESRANDGYENNLHLLYENKGKGTAYIFMNGKKIDAQWSKKDRASRMVFLDTKGKEIELNPGKIWISVIPTQSMNKVVTM